MLLVGIDDTDALDYPGTNKLARRIAEQLAPRWQTRWIVRHQLLQDPRVPCTNKNGCAALYLSTDAAMELAALQVELTAMIVACAAPGSDPGLCLAPHVPDAVTCFGQRCQRQLVAQGEARRLAREHGLLLTGLGGTEDGVIGALAAVGLAAGQNDGRVVYRGNVAIDEFDIGGLQPIEEVLVRGVDEVRCRTSSRPVSHGIIDLGKRLRPNLRSGRVVLFVDAAESADCDWLAVRVP